MPYFNALQNLTLRFRSEIFEPLLVHISEQKEIYFYCRQKLKY